MKTRRALLLAIALMVSCATAPERRPAPPLPSAESAFFSPEPPACDPATLEPSKTVGSDPEPLLPVARVKPVYPRRAFDEGMAGWVALSFTVTSGGRVCNVEVVEAEPGGVFDRNAVAAVRKWRYRPLRSEGHPIATTGVTARVVFEPSR